MLRNFKHKFDKIKKFSFSLLRRIILLSDEISMGISYLILIKPRLYMKLSFKLSIYDINLLIMFPYLKNKYYYLILDILPVVYAYSKG